MVPTLVILPSPLLLPYLLLLLEAGPAMILYRLLRHSLLLLLVAVETTISLPLFRW